MRVEGSDSRHYGGTRVQVFVSSASDSSAQITGVVCRQGCCRTSARAGNKELEKETPCECSSTELFTTAC